MIAENIRYFMYKYSTSMYDWEKPLNVVMKKVFNYDIAYILMLMIFVLQSPL